MREARKTLLWTAQLVSNCAGVMQREGVFHVCQDFLQYSWNPSIASPHSQEHSHSWPCKRQGLPFQFHVGKGEGSSHFYIHPVHHLPGITLLENPSLDSLNLCDSSMRWCYYYCHFIAESTEFQRVLGALAKLCFCKEVGQELDDSRASPGCTTFQLFRSSYLWLYCSEE